MKKTTLMTLLFSLAVFYAASNQAHAGPSVKADYSISQVQLPEVVQVDVCILTDAGLCFYAEANTITLSPLFSVTSLAGTEVAYSKTGSKGGENKAILANYTLCPEVPLRCVPLTIGKPTTSVDESYLMQSNWYQRTNHDRL